MKTLFLLRHAKSDRTDQTIGDFDRPLNARGNRTVATLASFFVNEKIEPDLVISSSAVRARETIEPILVSAGLHSEVRFDERVYEAPPERLLEVISSVESQTRSVLIGGHNPGLEGLLTYLTGQTEAMSTGALAKIRFPDDTNWNSLRARAGTLEWLHRPEA